LSSRRVAEIDVQTTSLYTSWRSEEAIRTSAGRLGHATRLIKETRSEARSTWGWVIRFEKLLRPSPDRFPALSNELSRRARSKGSRFLFRGLPGYKGCPAVANGGLGGDVGDKDMLVRQSNFENQLYLRVQLNSSGVFEQGDTGRLPFQPENRFKPHNPNNGIGFSHTTLATPAIDIHSPSSTGPPYDSEKYPWLRIGGTCSTLAPPPRFPGRFPFR